MQFFRPPSFFVQRLLGLGSIQRRGSSRNRLHHHYLSSQSHPWSQRIHWLTHGVLGVWLGLTMMGTAKAQIVPDGSLGAEGSIVTPNVRIRGGRAVQIDGGAIRANMLFHSFDVFNVGKGERVYFANPTGVETILSRVTGNDGSDILGSLGVNGSADLLFLNPNGIVFGRDATLDVRGAFYASTAGEIVLPGDYRFSALEPEITPLLTITAPMGANFSGTTLGVPIRDLTNKAELSIGSDQQLTLQGNTVMSRGGLEALAGSIQLLGNHVRLMGQSQINVEDFNIEAAEKVSITQNQVEAAENLNISVMDQEGIITLRGVDVIALGNTSIEGSHVNFTDNVLTLGDLSVDSDSLQIRDSDINILENTILRTNGLIDIRNSNLFALGSFNSENNYFQARDSKFTFIDIGDLANNANTNINLNTNLDLKDILFSSRGNQVWNNSQVLVGTLDGDGRNIQIIAETLDVLNSSSIIMGSTHSSQQGNLSINADQIRLTGIEGEIPNIIGVLNFNDSSSGNLDITANSLLMTDSSLVVTSSFGSKSGGNLNVDADHIRISGLGGNPLFPSFLAAVAAGQEDLNTFPSGGDIRVNANEILLDAGGNISTTTIFSSGGQIFVEADKIDITGRSYSSGASSGISSDSYGQGDGGVITVRAGSINLDNSGDISASNRRAIEENIDFNINRIGQFSEIFSEFNEDLFEGDPIISFLVNSIGLEPLSLPDIENIFQRRVDEGQNIGIDELGNAGDLFIYADDISIRNRSEIFARTRATGDGGNIYLAIEDFLFLDGSSIATTAGTDQTGGDGGDITIRADNGFIVGRRDQNGDIVANAFSGNGGNVNITAQDVFGFQVLTRNELNQLLAPGSPLDLDPGLLSSNDITAISQNSPQLSGTITFQTPDLDPSRGLIELPSNLLTATDRINTDLCQATATSSFTAVGRGGLPPGPEELFTSTDLWRDQRLTHIPEQIASEPTTPAEPDRPLPPSEAPPDLTEAQGWQIDDTGAVHLVTNPINQTPRTAWAPPQTCRTSPS